MNVTDLEMTQATIEIFCGFICLMLTVIITMTGYKRSSWKLLRWMFFTISIIYLSEACGYTFTGNAGRTAAVMNCISNFGVFFLNLVLVDLSMHYFYQLLQEKGREPTPEEIAVEMDMSVERVREILKISQEPVSLETPIGEEEDSHLGDFIQDDHVPVPADAATFTLLKEQLSEVLGTLTEREQKVLRLRFGLDDGRARTLEEVGKEFNVTRERIRQIEAKALRKLRHPSRSRKLKDYLD